MSAAVMMKRIAEASPQFQGQDGRCPFLLLVLTAAFTEFFARGRLNSRRTSQRAHRGLVHDRCDAALL
jgi:hypothetical protein